MAQRPQHGGDEEAQVSGAYRPPGPGPIEFTGFTTLNTESARAAIGDQDMSWCDGFMPIGKNTVRTMPGVGPPIFIVDAGRTIISFDFANIGSDQLAFLFLSDGSIHQVNLVTGVRSGVAVAGTVTAVTQVALTQWGSQFVLFVANQPNGYWVWDGTTFYVPNSIIPGIGQMPTGIRGSAIETYVGRVWIAEGATILFSAPGSFVDFGTADGGGAFTSHDSFTRWVYTRLVQTNGFLYLIGDSSINYISNVQTSGSPPTTTFTNQNADPEIGTPYPATVDVFSRNIVFANAFGAHISYGGSVNKISEALDGVYNSVQNFGGLALSATKAIVFGKRIWCLLVPTLDPVSGVQDNKLFCWDGRRWWSTRQDFSLIYVQHQEFNSVITAYGTDGISLCPLFKSPSAAFIKRLQSKLFKAPGGLSFTKTPNRIWGLANIRSMNGAAITVRLDTETAATASYTFSPPALGPYIFPPQAVAQVGVLNGMTISTTAADIEIIEIDLGTDVHDYRG